MGHKETDQKTGRKSKKKRQDESGSSAAQNSEYRDLRNRVEARKDAKQILKIAREIENEP